MRNQILSYFTGASATAGIATHGGGTTIVAVLPIMFKCKVRMVWALIQSTSAHGTGFVLHFTHNTTAGTTGSNIDILTKTISISQQGKFLYSYPTTVTICDEGDEIAVERHTSNGEACATWIGVELERIESNPGENSAMVAA